MKKVYIVTFNNYFYQSDIFFSKEHAVRFIIDCYKSNHDGDDVETRKLESIKEEVETTWHFTDFDEGEEPCAYDIISSEMTDYDYDYVTSLKLPTVSGYILSKNDYIMFVSSNEKEAQWRAIDEFYAESENYGFRNGTDEFIEEREMFARHMFNEGLDHSTKDTFEIHECVFIQEDK